MTGPSLHDLPPMRARILDTALMLFAENGYDSTSMRAIAEQLDITKAALYYHFDSKADIVRTMLAETTGQVSELVAWARAQPPGPGLSREVLVRWSDVMQARGLAAFRFAVANRRVIHDLDSDDPGGLHACLGELYALLAPADAPVETQLRTRLALMSFNMAGLVGADIDADESEILTAAVRLSLDLLPDG